MYAQNRFIIMWAYSANYSSQKWSIRCSYLRPGSEEKHFSGFSFTQASSYRA